SLRNFQATREGPADAGGSSRYGDGRKEEADMQDRQLYEQLLGLQAPWRVERVELNLQEGAVRVYLGHPEDATWCCPECARSCALHDHQPERAWRHLDTCQFETRIFAHL